MKHSVMKCTRWRWHWHSRLIGVPAAILFLVLSAQAQGGMFLNPIGGTAGNQFIDRCFAETERQQLETLRRRVEIQRSGGHFEGAPAQALLAGFELRAGDDIDAIRPLCVTALGPRETTPVHLTTGSGLVDAHPAKYGDPFFKVESGWYGGIGGSITRVICPSDRPIVTGMYVYAEGREIVSINNIHLYCGIAAKEQPPSELPSAIFDAPKLQGDAARTEDTERCPAGLVAVGAHGRAGKYVDAIGLICGEPKLPEVIKAIGRTKTGATTGPPVPAGPPRAICEIAREARARNSPAAPGLEAQCRAAGPAGETPPVKAIGRVKVTPTGAPPADAQPRPICDVAKEARARNSPAAPGLEARCRAAGEAPADNVDAFAATGAAIAEVDQEVAEARMLEVDESYQRGFDIATGIFGDPALGAKGNTSTGPGSLKIRDALNAAGQRGFNASVKLHLSRNYRP